MKNLYLLFVITTLLLCCDTPKQQADIVAASAMQLEIIRGGLNDETLTITRSCAVKSKDFKAIYMVGAKLSDGEIGVWAIGGSKTKVSMVFSVNAIAEVYSAYPINRERVNVTDHGAQAVIDHLSSE